MQMMDIFTTAGDRVNPTEDQLDLAGQLVRSRDQSRYTKVPFGSIIRQNQVKTSTHNFFSFCFYVECVLLQVDR